MDDIPIFVIHAAQEAEQAYGVPASITIAQWALESNYGKRMPKDSFNPFGIKGELGYPYVVAYTHEYLHGRYVSVIAKFRKFDNLNDAFEEHARLIASSKVYQEAMIHKTNPDEFARKLTGVYATDPHYGTKLISMMHSHNLYKFDKFYFSDERK